MNPKLPKVYLAIAATLILALTALGILRFGNPQWNKWIYICQCYYWPKGELQRPKLAQYYGDQVVVPKEHMINPPKNYSGKWITWFKNGKFQTQNDYLNGRIITFRSWNVDGKQVVNFSPYSQNKE